MVHLLSILINSDGLSGDPVIGFLWYFFMNGGMLDLDNIKADKTLNAKGLSCPMPLLKAKKEIDALEMEKQEKVRTFHLKASEILTAEQLGKLYVFQARFGGEVLEKMDLC